MSDIYREQGFGQSLKPGQAGALLVVDFVNGFADPAIFGGGNIAQAIAATRPVLASARAAGLPVIFTRIVYAADGSDAGVWCEKVPRLRDLTEEAPASQVVATLAPRPGEAVVRKTQASAFFGTGLAAMLIHGGIDTLFVTGCTTSGCVRATLIDAIAYNFRPFVVAGCVGDRALGPHEANLFDIGQKYADILPAAEAVAMFSRLVPAR